VAVARKLLARCFHVLTDLQTPVGEGPSCRVRSPHHMCLTTTEGLIEQPGPDNRHADPPDLEGPNGCVRDQLP
jgi:hypothetical protein